MIHFWRRRCPLLSRISHLKDGKFSLGASRYDVCIGGGRGSWKSRRIKGGCVAFILQISSKCGQGGGGQKIRMFYGCHKWMLPSRNLRRRCRGARHEAMNAENMHSLFGRFLLHIPRRYRIFGNDHLTLKRKYFLKPRYFSVPPNDALMRPCQ